MRHGVPKSSCPLQMKVDAWPAVDKALWAHAFNIADPLSPVPSAVTWRAVTKANVEKGYGRWLGWLAANHKLEDGIAPMVRASAQQVGEYAVFLRVETAPGTVVQYLQCLAMALTAMYPDADLRWLWGRLNKLQRHAPPSRRKRDRIVPVQELAAFGKALMNGASTVDPLEAAVRYRDGLLICLLAARPIRIRNLQMMEYGRHLVRAGDRYFLSFTAEETKTHQEIHLPLPCLFTGFFDTYLRVYRPVLLEGAKNSNKNDPDLLPKKTLWISHVGTTMSCWTLRNQISCATGKKFGKPVSPHLFRDCVATSIALDDPDHINITMSLLGHTTMATSERYYNHALARKAAGLHYRTIADLRRKLGSDDTPKISKFQRRKA